MTKTAVGAATPEPEDKKPIEGEFKEEAAKPNGELVPAVVPPQELALVRDPEVVLAEAKRAADAVVKVIKSKPKPVIIRGEQYLEIDDWSLLAQFYGCTAYTDWVRPRTDDVTRARGWEARALVIDVRTGVTVGAAEAMCMDDEEEWGKRPKYEWLDKPVAIEKYGEAKIVEMSRSKYPNRPDRAKVLVGEEMVPDAARRSMAQTRAGSRALAQRFRWIPMLAGLKGTPAEEMKRKDFDSGGDYEAGDVVHTANAQADQRARTPMTDSDKTLIQTAVRLLIEQAKANDPVAIAMQTAWNAWLTGKQGPGHGKPAENTKAVYDDLFSDDAYTYAAKRILGLKVDGPPPAPKPEPAPAAKGFDPDDVPKDAPLPDPKHKTLDAVSETARPVVTGPNAWPADEQKFIRDTYNAIVAIKKNKDKRETPAGVAQAEAVFNAFATWMNKNTLNWTGERGYTSVWSRYDVRDQVYELLGLGVPTPTEKPGFDPDEEAR